MSNRKYAAGLLEGGIHTEKERIDSVMVFVRQFVQETIEQFLQSPEDIKNKYAQETFQNIGQGKLIELAPALAERYHIVVGLSETSSGAFIGYREKNIPSWIQGNRHTFTSNGGIDIARMINESPRMDMGGGYIRTDTLSAIRIDTGAITANSIGTTHIQDATIGTLDADRVQPFTVRERYGPAYVVDPRAVARVNFDGPARRTSAPARLSDFGTVGG